MDGIISYGDKPYSPGEIINIGTEEEIPLIFTLTESGEGDLHFTFEDSAGQTRELTLPIEVEKNDITVTVTPTGGSAYDNHAKDIEIEVTPNSNGDVGKYSIKYEVLDGNGVIDQLTFVDGQGGKVPIGKFVPLGQFKRTIRLKSKPYRGANSGLLQR